MASKTIELFSKNTCVGDIELLLLLYRHAHNLNTLHMYTHVHTYIIMQFRDEFRKYAKGGLN